MSTPTVTETTARTAADHDDFFAVALPQPTTVRPASELLFGARRAALSE